MNFEKLTEYLDSLEEKYGIPANDCKVTKEHEVIYRKVTGHADYKKKVPLTASHMFRLFSATKLFTMTAVLQLVEQGKLGLYDNLTSYLPEFGCLNLNFQYTGRRQENHVILHTIRYVLLI